MKLILWVAVFSTSAFLEICLGISAMKLIPKLTHHDGWTGREVMHLNGKKATGASRGGCWKVKEEWEVCGNNLAL